MRREEGWKKEKWIGRKEGRKDEERGERLDGRVNSLVSRREEEGELSSGAPGPDGTLVDDLTPLKWSGATISELTLALSSAPITPLALTSSLLVLLHLYQTPGIITFTV